MRYNIFFYLLSDIIHLYIISLPWKDNVLRHSADKKAIAIRALAR